MCKLGGGANRCEAHWGPTQKAADLARRRAKYAAKKGGEVRAYTKQDAQAVLVEAKKASRFDAEDFKVKAINTDNPVLLTQAGTLSKTFLKETGETGKDESLGLHTAELSGKHAKSNYYAGQTIEGAVNWDNLDENSYRAFGFADISEPRGLTNKISFPDLHNLSEKELSVIPSDEKRAMSLFTGDAYEWINEALYNRDPESSVCREEGTGEGTIPEYGSWDEQSVVNLKKTVEKMDAGLAKGSGQQRIVYRGIKKRNLAAPGESLDDVFNKFQLGQEVVFDGYQSSSYSPAMASSFAGAHGNSEHHSGIVLEIRTSSGVNVINRSNYDSEQEVLLPRNARYMVVGKQDKVDYFTVDSTNAYQTQPQRQTGVRVLQLVEITENGEVASAENRPAMPPPLTSLQTTVDKN